MPLVPTAAPGTALIVHPGAELYGSDRVMLETVSALADEGWNVVVTTPAPGPLLDEVRRRGAQAVVLDVPVLRKSMLRPVGLLALAVAAVRALVRSARLLRSIRPDVLYVSTVTVPTWLVSARLAGIPAIAHVHEAERSARRPIRVALALPLLLARRVVVNSRFSLETLLADLPRIGARAAVVYNGVAGPETTVPCRSDLTGALRIVYVGRISERKGVDVAVEAVALLAGSGRRAELDIVGAVFPGYEWFEDQLRRRVAQAGLDGRVRFPGFTPSVWPALARADVVVVPSRVDEPFGNTAVEAVLAARPVIVSHCGGLPEAVEAFPSAQTVPPADPAALARAILEVADDWPDRSTQAHRDAPAAAAAFSPQRYREEILREIESALPRAAVEAERVSAD